jgi:hypothetical protein
MDTGRRKTLLQVTALAMTTLLASACHGGVTPTTQRPTTPAVTRSPAKPATHSRPSSAASNALTASLSPSPSSAAPAQPPLCATADLAVTVTEGEGAAGSSYSDLVLTNTSHHECSTVGYAGVSYVDHDGAQIGAPATRSSGQVRRVLLLPGKRATATLEETHAENFSEAECHPEQAVGLKVYPPDQTAAVVVGHDTLACAAPKTHLLSVAPFH